MKNLTPTKDIRGGLDESSPYMRLPHFYRNHVTGLMNPAHTLFCNVGLMNQAPA